MDGASLKTVIEEAIALARQQKQPIRILVGDQQIEVTYLSTLDEILRLLGPQQPSG
jgi:hypothetical protein